MSIKGNPRKFHKKFKFVVEIDGFRSSAFQKCSALEAELEVVSYREGGALMPDKDPGLLDSSNVTLERGACNDESAWNWFKEVVDMASGLGKIDDDFKKEVDIVQLDRNGSVLRRWSLGKTWPRKFVAGDWDNEASENVIEQLELVNEGFERA